MLTIRIDEETKMLIAYLRTHRVRFQPKLRQLIKAELREKCKEFKIKQREVKLPF